MPYSRPTNYKLSNYRSQRSEHKATPEAHVADTYQHQHHTQYHYQIMLAYNKSPNALQTLQNLYEVNTPTVEAGSETQTKQRRTTVVLLYTYFVLCKPRHVACICSHSIAVWRCGMPAEKNNLRGLGVSVWQLQTKSLLLKILVAHDSCCQQQHPT